MNEKTDTQAASVHPVVMRQCVEFDGDCLDMTEEQARWCYEGCSGHPCMPAGFAGFGTAIGVCPILTAIGSNN